MQAHALRNIFFLVVFLTACNPAKNTTSNNDALSAEKPAWMSSRPVNPAYYIGIGACSKVTQPLDYASIAQKNALNDLASGISVKVQGQTFLNSLEVNRIFSEDFISNITTTTEEQIEDYEIAGQWEDSKDYWVYYRLDKNEYLKKKQAKKEHALMMANDYYQKGLLAEKEGNITQAVDLFFHGLFELKDYWNDVNEFTSGEQKLYLDNELYSGIQRICGGIEIHPSFSTVVLNSENSYSAVLPVTVMYNGNPTKGISLTYSYDIGRFMKPRTVFTNSEGAFVVAIEDVNPANKANAVDIRISLDDLLPADLDKRITGPLIENVKADRALVPVELITPAFFVQSEEKYFGQTSKSSVLADVIKSELVRQGMHLSDNRHTNYILTVNADTRQGGIAQGFYVAYLELTLEVKNARTNEIVFQTTHNNVKGLQLSPEAAGVESYNKAREMLQSETVKTLLDAIL